MADHFHRVDLLVWAVAAAIYLLDQVRLLYVNEVLFIQRGSTWSVAFPSIQAEVRGRYLTIPAPFDPTVSISRLSWPSGVHRSGASESRIDLNAVTHGRERLRTPRVLCTLLLLQTFIGIPFFYLIGHHYALLAMQVLLIYAQTLYLIVWLTFHRQALQIPSGLCARLSFEALICIPLALNLHRRLSEHVLQHSMPNDVLGVGRKLLPAGPLHTFERELYRRASELMDTRTTQSPANGLCLLLQQLQQDAPP